MANYSIKGKFIIPNEAATAEQRTVTITLSNLTSIKWGDGTTDSNSSHTYAQSGTYSFSVIGTFTSFDYAVLGSSTSNSRKYLSEIEVGETITSIGRGAFTLCENLVKLRLWAAIQTINLTPSAQPPSPTQLISASALDGCTSLEAIEVASANVTFSSYNGDLYTKDGHTLIKYANGKANTIFTTPVGVTTIESYAFYGASNLRTITLSNDITTVNAYAFVYGIYNIVYGNNPSISTIKSRTYKYYYGLSVIIPASVSLIKEDAFEQSSVTTLICKGDDPATLETDAIPSSIVSIKVPSDRVIAYQLAWSDYYELITPVGHGVVGYNQLAYYDQKIKEYISEHGGGLPSSTKYGSSIDMSMNSSTYVLTVTLKDQDGNTLGTSQSVDLPLETMVINGHYDDNTKKVVLTLQNGSTVEFSVADLVSGLQTEITAQNKLSSDLLKNGTNVKLFLSSDDIFLQRRM